MSDVVLEGLVKGTQGEVPEVRPRKMDLFRFLRIGGFNNPPGGSRRSRSPHLPRQPYLFS